MNINAKWIDKNNPTQPSELVMNWIKTNNPGLVTNQYRKEDQTEEMKTLEKMIEDPVFWHLEHNDESVKDDLYFLPNEELWDKISELVSDDPDCFFLSFFDDNPVFEIT